MPRPATCISTSEAPAQRVVDPQTVTTAGHRHLTDTFARLDNAVLQDCRLLLQARRRTIHLPFWT